MVVFFGIVAFVVDFTVVDSMVVFFAVVGFCDCVVFSSAVGFTVVFTVGCKDVVFDFVVVGLAVVGLAVVALVVVGFTVVGFVVVFLVFIVVSTGVGGSVFMKVCKIVVVEGSTSMPGACKININYQEKYPLSHSFI